MSNYNNTFNYTDTPEFVSGNYNRFLKSAKILFGNRERTEEFDENYFLLLQNYETYNSLYKNSTPIYMYHFCLNPKKIDPSGSCNFSKIKYPQLQLTVKGGSENLENCNLGNLNIKVYGISYNILNIASGRAGLSFDV